MDAVDFITSPGFLTGGDSQRAAGLRSGQPAAVVSDRALLDFEEVTELPEPSAEELEMLRELCGGGGGRP